MLEEKLNYVAALEKEMQKLNLEKQEVNKNIDALRQEWEQNSEKTTELKRELSGLNTSFAGTIIHMFTAPLAAGLFPFGEITILLLLTLGITVPLFFKLAKKRITVAAKVTTAILERTYIEKDLEREEALLTSIEQALLKKEETITQINGQITEMKQTKNKTNSKNNSNENKNELNPKR
jgi:predicted  nucleic acid-binding Zn-ribbon protein